MSGFLVLIGCLAVVTLIAIPSFARANAALTAAAQTSSLTREVAAPIYISYLKGAILPDPSLIKSGIKLDALSCQSFTVTLRTPGLAPLTTQGVSDGKGGCTYDFAGKVPAGAATWTIGVQNISLVPTGASLTATQGIHKEDSQFNKLYVEYKNKADDGAFLKNYASEFTFTKGADLSIKGESQSIKIDGKGGSVTMPVYFSW
jgi:hypothetical protein